MLTRVRIVAAIALTSLTCFAWLMAQPRPEIFIHPFPMTPGTSWVYQGEVHWQDRNNATHEQQVSWRTEIRNLVEHPGAKARVASIYGYPSDLDWPTQFDGINDVAWLAVILLLADVVVEAVRRRGVRGPSPAPPDDA